jgi:hypothetical protein
VAVSDLLGGQAALQWIVDKVPDLAYSIVDVALILQEALGSRSFGISS